MRIAVSLLRRLSLVKIVYADVKTKKGETVWTGFEPGGELQYASLRSIPTQAGGGIDSIRILGYQNADWDWRTFDLDRDLAMADEKAGFIDAHTYDLSAFKAHGGKLLLYHGWADQAIPPGHTINFYNGVLAKMGAKQDDWMKLYMVPGMMHCQGGEGPDQFNKMGVMERWREVGRGAEGNCRGAREWGFGGSHAPAVRLSAGGGLQGHRQHKRRRKLCVQAAVILLIRSAYVQIPFHRRYRGVRYIRIGDGRRPGSQGNSYDTAGQDSVGGQRQ